MSIVGVLIETIDGKIKKSNFGVLTAASDNGNNEVNALMSTDIDSKIDILEQYGVTRIIRISSSKADLINSPDLMAQAIIRAMEEYGIMSLIGLSSPIGKDLLSRIASQMSKPLIQDCIRVDLTEKIVIKSHFSGKTTASVKIESDYFICGIRPNAIESVKKPCKAKIIDFDALVGGPFGVRIKEIKQSDSNRLDLTEVNIIISGGRPMGSEKNFSVLNECATKLGAAVGASRSAVDAGFAPHGIQVGQTGKTVSPKLYIACGISGAVQHYAGMKTSKIIVAINTDKDAPILGKCDYGIIGDLFEIVPAITEALK